MSQREAHLSRTRRLTFMGIVVAVPLLVCALLVEGVLRFVVRAPTDERGLKRALADSAAAEVKVTDNLKGLVQPAPEPELIYELKPGRSWIFRGAATTTNQRGYRGPDWTSSKAPGTLRVAGIGDSVMFGWGVADDATYMARLQALLSGHLARPVEVLNFAVPGYNSRQEAALFRTRVLPLRPDVLIVNYCLNDWAAPFFLPREQAGGGIVESSVALRYVQRLAYPMGDDVATAALADIAETAQSAAVPVVFCVFPQATDTPTLERLRSLAAQHGWHYVDLHAVYAEYLSAHGLADLRALYVHPDDPHPTTVGHQLIAAALEPVVVGLAEAASHPVAPGATPSPPPATRRE